MTRHIRVAVVGGLGLGGLAESMARGFRSAGCQTEIIPYQSLFPSLHRPGIRGTGLAARVACRLARARAERLVVRMLRAFAPSLVMFVKCDDLGPHVYAQARSATRAILAAFHPDDPFRAAGWLTPGPSHRNAIAQMRSVDAYFVWSPALARRAAGAGARAHVLLFAADPLLHHPVELSARDQEVFGADATFVGNWDKERERWLAGLSGCRLAIWGNGYWGRACTDPMLRRAWRGRPLLGEDMAKATLASAVNLNILRTQNKDACNMRTFEIPACGGFLLHERSAGLHGLLTPGLDYDDFATPDELAAKLSRWLADPARRKAIAARGHATILRQTYAERATEILRTVNLLPTEPLRQARIHPEILA